MIEGFRQSAPGESFESRESPRVRLQVFEGKRGAFEAEKKEASRSGVETIDPLHAGVGPAISQINELSKKSLDYTVCTGILARGYTKNGTAVSFITHMIPSSNPEIIKTYDAKLRSRLTDFVAETDPTNREFGFFAGEKDPLTDPEHPFKERAHSRNDWYQNMQDLTYQAIRGSAGQEPQLLFGPNKPGEHSDIFIDTAGGKLYIERY